MTHIVNAQLWLALSGEAVRSNQSLAYARKGVAMTTKPAFLISLLALVGASAGGTAAPPEKTNSAPLGVGPVALTGTTYASAATVTANALGSGVNGPETAQTGLTVNISKDNWWTGGKVGEIDGINVMMRQNAPGSDGSGILINVQNQGVLVQNSHGASWQYAFKYEKDGAVKFAVDGAGGVHTSGSFHINLATPAKSSSPCATGQLGADRNYVYVCVSPNTWKRSTLSSF